MHGRRGYAACLFLVEVEGASHGLEQTRLRRRCPGVHRGGRRGRLSRIASERRPRSGSRTKRIVRAGSAAQRASAVERRTASAAAGSGNGRGRRRFARAAKYSATKNAAAKRTESSAPVAESRQARSPAAHREPPPLPSAWPTGAASQPQLPVPAPQATEPAVPPRVDEKAPVDLPSAPEPPQRTVRRAGRIGAIRDRPSDRDARSRAKRRASKIASTRA